MDSPHSRSLQAAVEEAEAHFLLGNFPKSLLLCNQILSNANNTTTATEAKSSGGVNSSKSEKNEEGGGAGAGAGAKVFPLETPLQLSIDPTNKIRRIQISIRLSDASSLGEEEEEEEEEEGEYNNAKDEEKSNNVMSRNSIIDWIDRAAGVALQCWYEIARQMMNQRQQQRQNKSSTSTTASMSTTAQGYVHLLPFLNLYTTPTTTPTTRTTCNTSSAAAANEIKNNNHSCRPMPLELAVVFVQFLQTGIFCAKDRSIAVDWISEILFRLAGSSGTGLGRGEDSLQQQQQKVEPLAVDTEESISSLEELFFLLMVEILPFCTSQSLVVKILKRLLQPVWRRGMSTKDSAVTVSGRRRPCEEEFIMSDHPNSDCIHTILSFLNSMPPKWSHHHHHQQQQQTVGIFPCEQFIEECRASLQNILKSIDEQQHGQQQQHGTSPYYYSKSQHQLVEVEDGNSNDTINRRSFARRRLTFLEDQGTPSSLVGELDDLVLSPPTTTNSDHRMGYHILLSSLSNMPNKMSSIIQKCKKNKESLAFILLLTILAWKKRKRVLSLSSSAIRVFLAPIREVVDALMLAPPPRPSNS